MGKKKDKNSSVFLEENEKIDQVENLDEDIEQGIDIVNRNREELEQERNQRINKFERNANGQLIERPKIRYAIDMKFVVISVLVIIIIAYALYEYGPIFGIHITSSYSTDIDDYKIELVTKDSDIYGTYNDELFVCSNSTITTYNENCEVTWTYTFTESFSPSIYTCGNFMLVTNDSTGMIYLFEKHNEILSKKLDGTIKNAFLDTYGNIAIEYSLESGYNNVINVYNKGGDNLYTAYLTEESVVALEILDDGNRLIFAEAVTDSSTIGIKFRQIDISKSDDEQISDIISLDDNFVYDFIVQGKVIYALLDDSIVSIDIDSSNITTLKEFDSTQLMFVALNDNYYTYLERDIEEDTYVISNVNYNGNVIYSTTIDTLPKSMVTSDFVNYYIYQDHVYILNKWGVELGERETNFTPKQTVVFNNDKSLALIYTNKIYIINL